MEEVKELIAAIRQRQFAPVYFLMGEEPYYIDRISEFIAETVLTEEERGFNQAVLYGKDVTLDEVVGQAKRFPMMSEYQVIIVREAQHLSRTIEQLVSYVENPQPSTLLVFCYKYKVLDKRKKLGKALKKNGCVLFESRKLYENQVADWIRRVLLGDGYTISHKASALLVEFLGTDLSKISKELEKLKIVLPKGSEITPATVEDHIGISKDYNNFELRKAIATRDIAKATRIIKYFAENPKENPFVMTIALLHNFFVQLLQYHGLKDHSPRSVAQALHINPYFVGEYQTAARNYPMKRVSAIIGILREMDVKGKGVGSASLTQQDLLRELLYKIS
ncbi:DNA polymerase III subunit delta [Robiginitalea sp. M366]|uniref:DNA polymerase III subunit delta n=1 Tax=Robiginitalea aestuariiviva TaxID=3036903 RepID=UPI00240D04CE|nr:DNA polymerase III subunit delta [Robiginitalea aestuariiviva]MDG1572856.1 DNA polymerase III subunit delta [Robiginitalea aestuariiviva]